MEQTCQPQPSRAEGQRSTLSACRHSFPLSRSDALPCSAPVSPDLWALGGSAEDSGMTSLTFGTAQQSGNSRSKHTHTSHPRAYRQHAADSICTHHLRIISGGTGNPACWFPVSVWDRPAKAEATRCTTAHRALKRGKNICFLSNYRAVNLLESFLFDLGSRHRRAFAADGKMLLRVLTLCFCAASRSCALQLVGLNAFTSSLYLLM